MTDVYYYLMLAFLLSHELDAVRCREWLILPGLSHLSPKTGEQVFIWGHVPLLVVLFVLGAADSNSTAADAISGFAILHVVLHWLFRAHSNNEFVTLGSWSLIVGAAIFGALHLFAN